MPARSEVRASVTLALSRLAAIAQAERRQRLLESKAQTSERMQAIVAKLEHERQVMRVIKEVSLNLS